MLTTTIMEVTLDMRIISEIIFRTRSSNNNLIIKEKK